jgi:hypothetical protein
MFAPCAEEPDGLASDGLTFEEVILEFALFQLEIEVSGKGAFDFIVLTDSKRVLSLETVGNDGNDGSSSDENGGGNFHLDHDNDLLVEEKWGRRSTLKVNDYKPYPLLLKGGHCKGRKYKHDTHNFCGPPPIHSEIQLRAF